MIHSSFRCQSPPQTSKQTEPLKSSYSLMNAYHEPFSSFIPRRQWRGRRGKEKEKPPCVAGGGQALIFTHPHSVCTTLKPALMPGTHAYIIHILWYCEVVAWAQAKRIEGFDRDKSTRSHLFAFLFVLPLQGDRIVRIPVTRKILHQLADYIQLT